MQAIAAVIEVLKSMRMMNIVVKAIKTMVPSEFLDGVIRADYLRL